jgi:hypothetical protein
MHPDVALRAARAPDHVYNPHGLNPRSFFGSGCGCKVPTIVGAYSTSGNIFGFKVQETWHRKWKAPAHTTSKPPA